MLAPAFTPGERGQKNIEARSRAFPVLSPAQISGEAARRPVNGPKQIISKYTGTPA